MFALPEEVQKTRFNGMSFANGKLEDTEDTIKKEESI
jgi:hypothetical protein